jgi:hypothetical protein
MSDYSYQDAAYDTFGTGSRLTSQPFDPLRDGAARRGPRCGPPRAAGTT